MNKEIVIIGWIILIGGFVGAHINRDFMKGVFTPQSNVDKIVDWLFSSLVGFLGGAGITFLTILIVMGIISLIYETFKI